VGHVRPVARAHPGTAASFPIRPVLVKPQDTRFAAGFAPSRIGKYCLGVRRVTVAAALVCVAACGFDAALASPIELDSTARRTLLDRLRRAEADADVERVAAVNGLLARDALARIRRILRFQIARRDAATGLLPHSDGPPQWLPNHEGADLLPHLLIGAYDVAPRRRRTVLGILAAERATCGPFPCTVMLDSGTVVDVDLQWGIVCATEYGADGLLPPTERHGPGPWLDRLLEVTDGVLERAANPSPVGPLPGTGAESHGNLLQVLARLGHLAHDERHLAMAERIADAYLLYVAPAHRGLPAHEWDFARGVATDDRFRFRDHGAEILPGLAEAYLLERTLGRPSADRHQAPLRAMLDAALAVEREPDGLWRDEVEVSTGRTNGGAIDTWGYVLSAWAMMDVADGVDRNRATIETIMAGAASRHGYVWENGNPDGPADAIESMLILLPRYPIDGGAVWVDEEIEALFARQGPDGSAGAGYLDGNVIRSALLYADWKRAGVAARPPRRDLSLGASRDGDGRSIVLSLAVDRPWRGRLRFDRPRHATVWGMREDYPRRNSFPEWFPVDGAARYCVRALGSNVERCVAGRVLLKGLPIEMGRGRRRWRITRE